MSWAREIFWRRGLGCSASAIPTVSPEVPTYTYIQVRRRLLAQTSTHPTAQDCTRLHRLFSDYSQTILRLFSDYSQTILRLFSDYSQNSENRPTVLVDGLGGCTHTGGQVGAVACGWGFLRVSITLYRRSISHPPDLMMINVKYIP